MSIDTIELSEQQTTELLQRKESHFIDFKSRLIAPNKLSKSLSAFANADGDELYIGVDDKGASAFHWNGFPSIEDTNGLIQGLEQCFPLGSFFSYTFLTNKRRGGYILHVSVLKTQTYGTLMMA